MKKIKEPDDGVFYAISLLLMFVFVMSVMIVTNNFLDNLDENIVDVCHTGDTISLSE